MQYDPATLRCKACQRRAVWLKFDRPPVRLLVCWPCKGVLAMEAVSGQLITGNDSPRPHGRPEA